MLSRGGAAIHVTFSEIPVRLPHNRGGGEGEPLPQTPTPSKELHLLEFSIRTDPETSSRRRGWSGSEAGRRLR